MIYKKNIGDKQFIQNKLKKEKKAMKDDKKETAGEKMFIRNFKKTGGVDMSIAFRSSLTCWFGGQVC